MILHLSKSILILNLLLILVQGCGGNLLEEDSQKVSATNSDFDKEGATAEINSRIVYDDSGNIAGVSGLEPGSSLGSISSDKSEQQNIEDISKNRDNTEPLYNFKPPEGMTAEFSEPVMVTSASLRLFEKSDDSSGSYNNECGDLLYKEETPSVKTLFDTAKNSNSCGNITFELCIRTSFSNDFNSEKFYVYLKTPSISVSIPCASEAFDTLSVKINNDDSHASSKKAKIQFDLNPSLIMNYSISNNQNCISDDGWQKYTGFKEFDWDLNFIGNPAKATVYTMFEDVLGRFSGCIASSVLLKEPEKVAGSNSTIENQEPEADKPISQYTISECNGLASDKYLWFQDECKLLSGLSEANCGTLHTLEYHWGTIGADASCLYVKSLSEVNCLTFDSYIWDGSMCVARTGSSKTVAAKSCELILEKSFSLEEGVYWLDSNGGDTADAFQAYCDLKPGGGLTLNLNSAVSRTFAGRTITFDNISANQNGARFIQVAPGTPISLNLSWQSVYTSTYCPGCIQQFYFGLKNTGISCLYSGSTSSTRSGTGTLNINAPTNPGFYFVQAAASLQYSCTKTQSQLSDIPNDAIAVIQVMN